jgi:hypothetical protein
VAHKYSQYNCRRNCTPCAPACGCGESATNWSVALPWGLTLTLSFTGYSTDPEGCEWISTPITYSCNGSTYTDGEIKLNFTVQADGEVRVRLHIYRRIDPETTAGPNRIWALDFPGRFDCGVGYTLEEQSAGCDLVGDATISPTGTCCKCSCGEGSSSTAACLVHCRDLYHPQALQLDFSGFVAGSCPGGLSTPACDGTVLNGTWILPFDHERLESPCAEALQGCCIYGYYSPISDEIPRLEACVQVYPGGGTLWWRKILLSSNFFDPYGCIDAWYLDPIIATPTSAGIACGPFDVPLSHPYCFGACTGGGTTIRCRSLP